MGGVAAVYAKGEGSVVAVRIGGSEGVKKENPV